MTMRPAPLLCALALCAGVAVGVGCGDEGTIPSSRAQDLQQRLDQVRADIEGGSCDAASDHVAALRNAVDGLDVPSALRGNLRDGVDKLATAAADQCQDATTETQTTETPTTPTVTETAPTDTVTETIPTDTTPTNTTPTVPSETTPTDPTGGVQPEEQQGDGEGEFDGE